MPKELQIVYLDKAQEFYEGCNGLVLGDEGCVHRAYDSRWISIFREGISKGLSIRYLTPTVPQKHVKELYAHIEALSLYGEFKVTFNDYGFLYACKELIEQKRVIPVLGRILTRSIFDCAWHKRLLENENSELVKAVAGHSFANNEKLELIRSFGIDEIEINLLSDDYTLAYFNEQKIRVTGYLSNSIVSVGRLCFAARWYKLGFPECNYDIYCKNKLTIELDEMWGRGRLMYEKPSEEMKGYFKGNYVRGNIVYSEQSKEYSSASLKNYYGIVISE